MDKIKNLLAASTSWSKTKSREDPNFFELHSKEQKPKYLWVGCSDSRVPPTEILGLSLGDVFVHRNIANLIQPNDINGLSVLEYGINSLNIETIIICGHYGCGGVLAAMEKKSSGAIESWIEPIREVYARHKDKILSFKNKKDQLRCLVELNVKTQVKNVCQTSILQNSWSSNKNVTVCGLVFDIEKGSLIDLHCTVNSPDQVKGII